MALVITNREWAAEAVGDLSTSAGILAVQVWVGVDYQKNPAYEGGNAAKEGIILNSLNNMAGYLLKTPKLYLKTQCYSFHHTLTSSLLSPPLFFFFLLLSLMYSSILSMSEHYFQLFRESRIP